MVLGMVCLNQARGIVRCPANGWEAGVLTAGIELLNGTPSADRQTVRSVGGVPLQLDAVADLPKQAGLPAAGRSCCSLHKELPRNDCVHRLPFLTNW